jgi:dTDP-L-rhamnose 4-epimerase
MKVLIIGGAGFIGSHTADELARRGYEIRILDNLSPKTHFGRWPEYLSPDFEKIEGDVRDPDALLIAMTGVDYVINLAALMDLMPNFADFFDTNVTPTARIFEYILAKNLPIKKVVVASSQFAYGEGRWYCPKDGEVFPGLRPPEQLLQKIWDPVCPKCQGKIEPRENRETHQDPPNQYAISKYAQELIALKIGRQYGIPAVAMRYSIVHGPRQSLKNAYSGALRIFAMKMLKDEAPPVYEDGLMRRDFVSVFDVARANAAVLESDQANWENFNVGAGRYYTILDLAKIIMTQLGKNFDLKPTGQFRVGDIRHAVSDVSKLRALGWEPRQTEEEVVGIYLEWLKEEIKKQDYYAFLAEAEKKMAAAGVIKG